MSEQIESERNYPIPENEDRRLQALRRSRVLDTPDENDYDAITQIAKDVFDVPIAVISLVDECRQWFKSITGLDAKQTPRDVAFCAHVIMKDTPMIVLDATKDKRFKDNPLVTDAPGIRFYAGAPIISSEGHALGTVCAIDMKPRHYVSEAEKQLLIDLAAKTARLIENTTYI